MVIHSPAAFALEFLCIRKTSHVSPVVVRKKDGHIVRHAESCIIIILNLLVESPYLRSLVCRLLCHLADDLSLIVDHLLEQCNVSLGAHGLVSVASHTYCDKVFCILGSFDTFREEFIDDLLVCRIVPRSVLSPLAGPFLMVTCHRLMVGRTHDDAHLIRHAAVFRIVRIKCPAPHSRPEEVSSQTKNKLEDSRVKIMVAVICTIGILNPTGKAWSLIIEEDSPVPHGRLTCRVSTAGD